MAFVTGIAETAAAGAAAAFYERARAEHGAVLNLHRAFVFLPELFAHFETMTAALKDRMGLRRYELVTLAAALALKSSYCALAHGKVLLGEGMTPEELERIASDKGHTSITPQEAELMGYAADIVADATAIGPARIAALRAVGYSEDDIAQAAAAAALGTRPDPGFAALPEGVRVALARGRPVEDSAD